MKAVGRRHNILHMKENIINEISGRRGRDLSASINPLGEVKVSRACSRKGRKRWKMRKTAERENKLGRTRSLKAEKLMKEKRR